jgi:hypothetical protein
MTIELWACGFNQFKQIDDTGDNIYKPKLITTIPATSIQDVDLIWAGWADLLCTSLSILCVKFLD